MPEYTPPPVEFPRPTEDAKIARQMAATQEFLRRRAEEEARIHPPVHPDIVKGVRTELERLILHGKSRARAIDTVARKFLLSLEQVESELERMVDEIVSARVDRVTNTEYHDLLAGDTIHQLQFIRDSEYRTYRQRVPEDALASEKDRAERRRGEAADRTARMSTALLDVIGRVNPKFSPKNQQQTTILDGGDERARLLAEILAGQRQQVGGENFDAIEVAPEQEE